MNVEEFYHVIGATLVTYAVIQLNILHKVLEWKLFTLVGKYSFSLYLIHAQILLSVGGTVFLKFFNSGYEMNLSVFAGIFEGLLATIPATYLLHNFVDVPSGKLAKRFEKFFE